MKKVIAMMMVCGFAFAFVACGGGSKSEATTESTAAPADTTATASDTTKTDTTAVK